MKKFKIISTLGAIILMVAIFAFGVYAATEVKFTVSGTVSFTVTNVYLRACAGVGEPAGTIAEDKYYYSQPTAGQNSITSLTSFDGWATKGEIFKDNDEDNDSTYSCYLIVESLQGQDIYVQFGYEWTNTSKYNTSVTEGDTTTTTSAVKITVTEGSSRSEDNKTHTPTYKQDTTTSGKQTATGGDSGFVILAKGEIKTYKITLTFVNDAMVYKLTDGSLKLTFDANLDGVSNS